jgi:hypothetical protein
MKHAKHACNTFGVLGVVAKDANFLCQSIGVLASRARHSMGASGCGNFVTVSGSAISDLSVLRATPRVSMRHYARLL